ncbi:hypothetical protein [Streptomyces minutiscleroticus]
MSHGTTAPSPAVAEWQAWRARRHQALTSATGNLALVETRWLLACSP